MARQSTYQPSSGVARWFDERLPLMRFVNDHLTTFPTPKNLNYWWTFGGILATMLIVQIVSGIVVAMHYTPHVDLAWESVKLMRRDEPYGDIIQNIHMVGASMFFLAAYMHIFRGLYYGSYKAPREILWILGVVIFLLMMATAFLGYALRWGQMSFWGVEVITNFFSAIPFVGDEAVAFVRGSFGVTNETLNKFFSLHYLLPFMIAGVVALHVWALHVPGNNNPTGVDVKSTKDTLPFHPYYTIKDMFAIVVFFILFAWFIFYNPNILGEAENFIPADPSVTPPVVPEWYFLAFFAMLRTITFNIGPIDSLQGGVLVMFGAVVVWFFLPWLDTAKTRSGHFRPLFQIFFSLFVVSFLILTHLGGKQTDDEFWGGTVNGWALGLTIYYFAYFLVILPVLSRIETPKKLPVSISKSVLSKPVMTQS